MKAPRQKVYLELPPLLKQRLKDYSEREYLPMAAVLIRALTIFLDDQEQAGADT